KKRDEIQAKFWREVETIGKPWININKEIKLKDTIFKLKQPQSDPPTYATKSIDMANLAAKYHRELQEADLPDISDEEWNQRVDNHLERTQKKLNEEEKRLMNRKLTNTEIRKAIRELPNGKSPGLDGITVELYKKLEEDFSKNKNKNTNEENTHTFDVIKYLRIVLNDIAEHGPQEESRFSEGW
ncbi:hypothetical protein BJ165DRAFT_1310260, partial [Panaeolus papilionaceus]